MIKSYKDLDIWKRSIDLITKIYKTIAFFPKDEIYGLTSQMKRSAISIPSNIAEGFARQYNKEYKQFLYIALGSCAELNTQVITADKLGYLQNDRSKELQDDIDILSRMIMSLIKKINTNN